MLTDLWCHLIIRDQHGIQCMPCFSQIISEMLPEIHAMEKFDFLKPKFIFSIIPLTYDELVDTLLILYYTPHV